MDILKGLGTAADVLRKADKIPEYQQILSAMEQLTTQQGRISELEIQNRELKEKLKTKENLIHETNAYWIIKNEKKEGPFCTRCWDVNNNMVRMLPNRNPAFFTCPECKTVVQTNSNYRDPFTPRNSPFSSR